MKFGFVGPSYSAKSNDVADEECINFYPETNETPGAQTQRSYLGTPGLKTFVNFENPVLPSIPAPAPPFTPGGPSAGGGQSVVWAIATQHSAPVSFANTDAYHNSGAASSTLLTGSLGLLGGSPVDTNSVTQGWSNFVLSAPIPSDATITLVVPYATVDSLALGGNMGLNCGPGGAGIFEVIHTGANPAIAGGLTSLDGMTISAHIQNTLDGGDAALSIEISFVGVAVYYNSSEGPTIQTEIPLSNPNVGDSSPVRGQCWTGDRQFTAAGDTLYEVFADGTFIARMDGVLDEFGGPVSIAFSSIELLIVAGGRAYCYELADNTFQDITAQLASGPSKVEYSDGYFIVMFPGTNKFQISAILDGTTWPGIQVNEVSVFAENIISIEVSHRELWVFGSQHAQPYQDTGTDEIFDVIPGALIETGGAATFAIDVLDNTVFWISQDIRGARQAWRANGYTPQRISTHAVEAALSSYSADQITNLVSYSYQDGGHLFWVLYIPGTDCTWVYDVAESLWHKRGEWNQDTGVYTPHRSWNHTYAFGKHLVGDWASGNLNEMSLNFFDENGELIRRLRRSPTLVNEMNWVYHRQLVVDFAPGLGPQPPLTDGEGNPRPPQAMLRWSDNRGSTWSNQHIRGCGFAGDYNKRVMWLRLGRSRYRVYEVSVTDPIPWAIVDAYLDVA